jgi:hypothetical protein
VEGEKVSRGGGNLGTCLAIRSHPLCITTSTDTLAWRQETGWYYSPFWKASLVCDKCPFERMFDREYLLTVLREKPKAKGNLELLAVMCLKCLTWRKAVI